MQANELIAQADALKAEIDKLRPLKPEVERRIMQKFRLDWNYHSNAIEGNSLTLGETRAFLLEGLTANGKPMKDHLDIKGHDDLITFLELFIQRKEILTEAAIREMHKILLKEPYETDAVTPDGRIVKKKVQLGAYKTEPNFVRMKSGEIHHYILPEDVPAKMASLVEWHRQQDAKNDLHPLLHAALFHHQFASIHPFDDGNGRMARILMNLILMRAGFPPIVIKLQNRDPYIAALRRADAGENEAIVSFIGENLIDAETLYLRGAKGEPIEDFDDIDKKIALLKQELSNIAEPLELNAQIQAEFLSHSIKPCFNRLVRKLNQFDDLYSKNSFSAVVTLWVNPQLTSQTNWQIQPPETKNDILERLDARLKLQGALFSRTQFSFNWNGFKRAGTNTFSDDCTLMFSFQKYQYSVNASRSGFPVFDFTDVYQTSLSEDQILKIVNGLAEACLKHIEQQVRRKK
jgi:Fic family protein